MTSPLVTEEVDLRDFAYMPLDVVRLRDSDLSICSTGDEFRCAVLLWCASWHQRPAASLPDNDVILANLSGFGRDIQGWKAAREGALRNWIKCDDGRLYHPVVAEKANEAWEAKLKQRARTAAARAAKSNRNCDNTQDRIETDSADHVVASTVTEIVTGSKGREGKGEEDKKEISSLRSDSVPDKPAASTKKAKSERKVKTELPDGWQPDQGDLDYSAGLGLSAVQFDRSLESLRLWAKANRPVKADWHAALKGFLRRDAEKFGVSTPVADRPSGPTVTGQFYAKRDSPQWVAWAEYWFATKGKYPPSDAKGGWFFPAEFPPMECAAA